MARRELKCPECGAMVRVSGSTSPGKRIRCTECDESFRVPDMDEQEEKDRPARRSRTQTDDAKPAKKARREDDDAPRRRKKNKEKQSSGKMIALAAGGVGVLVLLVVLVVVLTRGGSNDNQAKGKGPGDGSNTPPANRQLAPDPGYTLRDEPFNPVYKNDPNIHRDPRWKKGAEAAKLIVGNWRTPSAFGYHFRADGSVADETAFTAHGTYLFVGNDQLTLTLRQGPLGSKLGDTVNRMVRILVDDDELFILTSLPGLNEYSVGEPYYRVPDDNKRGNTKYLDPYLKLLDDPDPQKRLQAAQTLSRLGADSWPGIPTMAKHAESDKNLHLRGSLIAAIGKCRSKAKSAVPTLRKILNEREPVLMRTILDALSMIGPDAREAIDDLKILVQDPVYRGGAQSALNYIDPTGKY